MGRIPRWRLGKGVYHVFNRGLNNSWILSRRKDRDVFLALLDDQRSDFKLNIYHYVIMSNHFHLAIEALDMKELSAYIGSVCALYSRYWHCQSGNGRGTIWQGRYKSIAVQKDNYMNRLGRYIERNPIAANQEGITTAEEYIWSSAAVYINGKADPLVNASQNPYWEDWGMDDVDRQQRYTRYLNVYDNEDVKLFSSTSTVIGDDDFKKSHTYSVRKTINEKSWKTTKIVVKTNGKVI